MSLIQKRFYINGTEYNIMVPPEAMLSTILREQLGLTGTKVGCGDGQCGVCSVLVDGKVIRSCVTKMRRIDEGCKVTTIEGIGTPHDMHPLQKAFALHGSAQCGFCSPGFIVSAKGLLDENPSPTREEVRDWFRKHRNACRCTGYIPIVDAVMHAAEVLRGDKPASSLDFVMPSDGRVWGSKYPRPTAPAKVTGTLDYGADIGVKMPADTLHLALVQAKEHHALIKNIDTAEAEQMPGVVKVITAKDIKGSNRIFGLVNHPNHKGDGWERPILCDTKIFQYGDPVAIICAESREQALAAADTVALDLEVLPAYLSVEEAMEDDALEIHPGTPNIYWTQPLIKGEDPEDIFARDDVVTVSGEFRSSRQPHMALEPDSALAYMGTDGLLHIHSKSIAAHLHGLMIAAGIGLEPEKIVIVTNPMGGNFGYKLSPTTEAFTAVATLATGRPSHILYNYKQQMNYTGKRSPFHIKATIGADKKTGRIVGLKHDYSVDHGPYCEFSDMVAIRGIQYIGACYDIPNIRGFGRAVATNHAWGTAFRGFGSPESFLAGDQLVDELALALGEDPFEFRAKNSYTEGSFTPVGQKPDVIAMIEKIRPRYQEFKEHAQKASTAEVKFGVGVSFGTYNCGGDGIDSAELWVQLDEDNGITVGAAWSDHGQGSDMGAVGTAHEALRPMNIPVDKIRFSWADSSKHPVAGPIGAERSQVVLGGAIRVACENLMEAAKKADGSFMDYAEMKANNIETRHLGSYSTDGVPCAPDTGLGTPFSVFLYCIHLVEVSVEVATGKTKVERMVCAVDIGKVGNQLLTDGQIYGSLQQGVGFALSEQYEDVEKHSTLIGAGFPFINMVPDDIEILYFQDNPRQYGAFGAAGVGEGITSTPHTAILNAIKNACGARITHIPATPDKVLAAMKL